MELGLLLIREMNQILDYISCLYLKPIRDVKKLSTFAVYLFYYFPQYPTLFANSVR